MIFSLVVLLGLASISLWAFLLLVQAYLAVPGSFGGKLLLLYSSIAKLIV